MITYHHKLYPRAIIRRQMQCELEAQERLGRYHGAEAGLQLSWFIVLLTWIAWRLPWPGLLTIAVVIGVVLVITRWLGDRYREQVRKELAEEERLAELSEASRETS